MQLFEEVPELAARAISHLLDAHPRSVVDHLIRAGGLASLCPFMILDDPMNHHAKGTTERAIKVNESCNFHIDMQTLTCTDQIVEHVCASHPRKVFEMGGLQSALSFLSGLPAFFPADVTSSVLRIVQRIVACLHVQEIREHSVAVVEACMSLLTDPSHQEDVLRCLVSLGDAVQRNGGDMGSAFRSETLLKEVFSDDLSQELSHSI